MHLAYFPEWKGTETLLFSCNDVAALRLLESAIAQLAASEQREIELHKLPLVHPHGVISLVGYVAAVDCGAFRDDVVGSFRWVRSPRGWASVAAQIRSLVVHSHAAHQYLDGPADKVSIELALGEYSDEWWQSQA